MTASQATKTVLIMAGGTGGHVFPALSIAEQLTKQGHQVHWLGTLSGIEAQLVPQAGYGIDYMPAVSVRGARLRRLLLLPFRLLFACYRAGAVLLRVRPHVVLGMGGYVSAPGGLMAWLLRIPLVIHEQNAVPGLTNRWLAKIARRCLCAFPAAFDANRKALLIGNPVRQVIAQIPPPAVRFAKRNNTPLRLLILGGSQGAQPINTTMPTALAAADTSLFQQGIEIWHQTGKKGYESTAAAYQSQDIQAKVTSFIDDMSQAYAWADVVLCRSGAMTLAELMCAGVPSVLVPLPHAADNHQAHNAQYLIAAKAAVLCEQADLATGQLIALLSSLDNDRTQLLAMAQAAHQLAHPDAAAEIVTVLCGVGSG